MYYILDEVPSEGPSVAFEHITSWWAGLSKNPNITVNSKSSITINIICTFAIKVSFHKVYHKYCILLIIILLFITVSGLPGTDSDFPTPLATPVMALEELRVTAQSQNLKRTLIEDNVAWSKTSVSAGKLDVITKICIFQQNICRQKKPLDNPYRITS